MTDSLHIKNIDNPSMQTKFSFERIRVESSSLTSVLYYDQHKTLEVEFRHGSVYRYFAVPHVLYQALCDASSKGTFFNRSIRDQHRFERVS